MRFTQIFGTEEAPRVTVSDDDANGWTVGPAYALAMVAIAGTVAASSMAAQIANSRYDSGELPIAAPTTMLEQNDGPPRTIVFDEQRFRAAVLSWQTDDETPALHFVDQDDAAPRTITLDEQRLAQAVRSWQTDDETPPLSFALDAEQEPPSVVWPSGFAPRSTWLDEEIVSISIDEDPWKGLEPEWPSLIITAQWSWDDGDALPIQSGSTVPDEWSWIPPASQPAPAPSVAWRFDADESVSTVGGAPEELGLVPAIPAITPAPFAAWRFDSDESISTVGAALEEYTWTPAAPSVPPLNAVPTFDDGGLPIAAAVTIVDDDAGPALARFAADVTFAPLWADDDGGTPVFTVPTIVDDDAAFPMQRFADERTLSAPWSDDGGTPISAVIDEDYTPSLARFVADVTAPAPWADDEGAQPSQAISDADECAWVQQIAPVSFIAAGPWQYDDGGTPSSLVPDEDGWRPPQRFVADFAPSLPWPGDDGAQPTPPVADGDECDWPVAQSRRAVLVPPFSPFTLWDDSDTGQLVAPVAVIGPRPLRVKRRDRDITVRPRET